MSQTNTARYKYNPNEMGEDEFLQRFVVRQEVFDEVFEALQGADYTVPNQHHILVGQRGQGKTTILRKINIEITKDKKLSKFVIPVQFTEEQYSMRGLCSLWERVAEHLEDHYAALFEDALEQVEMHEDDDNYEMKCFSYLEKLLKKQKKKLVLLIDNINILLESLNNQEQHHLREILLTSSSFIIVGGSTKMFEQQYEYSKPFYEFFNIIALEGLTFEESIALLKILGDKEQTQKIEHIIEHNPARIETLRRVTGGVPRTMVMLFDIFIEDNGNTFNDLMKVLDDVTPLYQERMNHIPKVLQNITHAIALNWDGMLTKEIANKTKLESKVVSAQLKQLEKYQIVDSVSLGKNKIYSIKERFFNIWYLMRFGKKKDRNRVEWLIQFLLAWYSKDELEEKTKYFMRNCKTNVYNPHYVLHYTEALSYAGISDTLESELKQHTKLYLDEIGSSLKNDLSQSNHELYQKVLDAYANNDKEKAIKILEKSGKENGTVLNELGTLYIKQKEYDKAEGYYLKAIESGDVKALNNLGILYNEKKEYDKAEGYYLKAIESGDVKALYNLGNLYNKQKEYDKAETYYLKSIESENVIALNNFGTVYYEKKEYDKAETYYLKAIESGETKALNNLGILYNVQKEYDKAETYYLKAIESGDADALNNIAWLYFELDKEKEKALGYIEKYYLDASDYRSTHTFAVIELWLENFSHSYEMFLEWMKYDEAVSNKADMSLYMNLLIAKGQRYKAKAFLEMPEYQLKERYKPIWYALMSLMQDDFPHEIKKMGSELKDTVDEVLEEIERLRVKYA